MTRIERNSATFVQSNDRQRWSYWDIEALRNLIRAGFTAAEIADRLARSEGAIRSRAKQLGYTL